MTPTMKAVEKARAEVARLMAVEADFSRQLARKQAIAKGADLGSETLEAALAGDRQGSGKGRVQSGQGERRSRSARVGGSRGAAGREAAISRPGEPRPS